MSNVFSENITAITTTISLIAKLKPEIIKLTNLTSEEFDNFFKRGLQKYLDNQFDKFCYTKTFLYRDEKVPFYSVFFPIQLESGITGKIDTTEITSSLFEKSNNFTILGHAGSGKTMLLKHIFLKSYSNLLRIPIIIDLRNFNEFEGKMIDYIKANILENKITASEKILERILASGKFIFLFDGYDEIYSEHIQILTQQIESFVDQYSNNFFVISSRPGANAEALSRFNNLYVSNLNKLQIEQFIDQQLGILPDKPLAEKIINVINKSENIDYQTYLSNPLLLSMFIFTFKQYPELPKSKSKFYWNVYDTLITKHDSFSKKGGWQHERKTSLQNEEIEKILKWFSYSTLFKGQYNFEKQEFIETLRKIREKISLNFDVELLIEDLTVGLSLIILDGTKYTFIHRSFQEYFCASLIHDLDNESNKKVYTTKFDIRVNKTTENFNLWNLCKEIDKLNFYNYFLIQKLENFINLIDSEDDCRMLTSLIKETGFEILISINKVSKDIIRVEIARGFTSINNVLIYLKLTKLSYDLCDTSAIEQLYRWDDIWDFYNKGLASNDQYDSGDEDDEIYNLYLDRFSKSELEYIESSDLIENLRKLIKKTKKTISELKLEVKHENRQTFDLLDI